MEVEACVCLSVWVPCVLAWFLDLIPHHHWFPTPFEIRNTNWNLILVHTEGDVFAWLMYSALHRVFNDPPIRLALDRMCFESRLVCSWCHCCLSRQLTRTAVPRKRSMKGFPCLAAVLLFPGFLCCPWSIPFPMCPFVPWWHISNIPT